MDKMRHFNFEYLVDQSGNSAKKDNQGEFVELAGPNAKILPVEEATPEPEIVVKSYNEADLAQSKQEGYEEGLKISKAEIEAFKENETKNLIEAIAKLEGECNAIKDRYDADLKTIEALALDLASKIAKKIAGDALKDDPAAEIKRVLEQALLMVNTKDLLVIKMHPDMVKKFSVLYQQDHKKLQFEPVNELAITDCEIEWQFGYIEHKKELIMQQIESLLSKH